MDLVIEVTIAKNIFPPQSITLSETSSAQILPSLLKTGSSTVFKIGTG
jgi:hypothetical protein